MSLILLSRHQCLLTLYKRNLTNNLVGGGGRKIGHGYQELQFTKESTYEEGEDWF